MRPSEPIHVCHVGPYPLRRGGISAVVAMLQAVQRSDPGLRVACLATSVDGGRAAKLVRWAVSLRELRRRLDRHPRTVLHVHTAHGASFRRKAAVLRLAARRGAPCLLHVHSGRFVSWFDRGSPRRQRWVRAHLDRACAVVGLSRTWEARLREITSTPVHTVYNGVDVEAFRALGTGEPAEGEALRLLLLGGVGLGRKGAFELVEALGRLRDEAPGPRLHLDVAGVGEAGEETRLREAVHRAGLVSDVELVGWAGPDRKRELLQRAHVFVLPSFREGVPIAMLEAMACALPVLASPVGGIPEVLRDGANALLVPPGDVDALTRAIRTLRDDPHLRRRLARAGRATVEDGFDVRAVAARFRTLYEQIAGDGLPGG